MLKLSTAALGFLVVAIFVFLGFMLQRGWNDNPKDLTNIPHVDDTTMIFSPPVEAPPPEVAAPEVVEELPSE